MIYETPKQGDISKQLNVENEILVILYKKKDLNQMTESDRKETKTRQSNLEKLKKKHNDLKLSRKRLKKYRFDRKRKLDVLDEITRNKVSGKETPD